MKKSLFILSIVALVFCNLYFLETNRDISTISLKELVSISQAQAEDEEGWYTTQECLPCTTEYGQPGVVFNCWYWWGDTSKHQDCFNQPCGYGLCY